MDRLNPKFYWTDGTTSRGEYLAMVGTWVNGQSQNVEAHLFRTPPKTLLLVDRLVMPVGDWLKSEPLTEEQLQANGLRLAQACMTFDLFLTALAAWPGLVALTESQFVSRLLASGYAAFFFRLTANSRCDAAHSFRERLLSVLHSDPEFRLEN